MRLLTKLALAGLAAARVKKAIDERTCPYCAERIKAKAIKCKHCGSNLEKPKNPPS